MIKERDTTIGYHCPFCGMSILNNINIFSMTGNLIKIKCVCGGSELTVQIMKDNKYRITVPCILCPNSHSFTLSSDAFFRKDLFSFSCKFTAINICFIGKGNRVYEALKKNEEELMKTFAAYEEEYNGELDGIDPEDDLYLDGDDGDDGKGWYFDDDGDEDDESYLEDFKDFDLKGEQNDFGFVLHKNNDFKPELPDNEYNAGNSSGTDEISVTDGGSQDALDNLKIQSYQIVSQVLDSISKLYDEKKVVCKCGDLDGKIVILGNSVHIECKNCGSYRNVKSSTVADAEYLSGMEMLYLDFDD